MPRQLPAQRSGDNVLDGGDGADSLSGLGGNDTFVLKAGQAHGT